MSAGSNLMIRWELIFCWLFGHDVKRYVYARLEIPGADRFVAGLCLRCAGLFEDTTATATEYLPCQRCDSESTTDHPAKELLVEWLTEGLK